MSDGAFKQRIGIAITTLNRRDDVCRQVAEIRRLTNCNFELVICDDGSNDDTPQALRNAGEIVIQGVNRGVAWNKNRGIFYLMAVCGCDIVILLDDDMVPDELGWQDRWIQGATNFGHVNYIYATLVPELDPLVCTAEAPGLSAFLLGSCIAFHRYAWSMVGYMDPRFQKYGHEHTEFTNRFLRNGFGGIIKDTPHGREHYYFVIGGGIHLLDVTSQGRPSDIDLNARIWQEIEAEQAHTHRAPWRDNAQRAEFLAEIKLSQRLFKAILPRQSESFVFGGDI